MLNGLKKYRNFKVLQMQVFFDVLNNEAAVMKSIRYYENIQADSSVFIGLYF